ncbi:MAG: hypothetical protein J6R47_06615 [Acholeplasmatales bacterium]|nr:hypothetical protein [Acholeplasmatales bacterium]
MEKTSKEFMEWLGLQVGDRFRINNEDNIYIVELDTFDKPFYKDKTSKMCFSMVDLLDKEIEILPRPKRVGDLECSGNCKNCPLMSVCSWDSDYQGKNLYGVLDYELTTIHDDQEIYDLLKVRLDKEVVEENEK